MWIYTPLFHSAAVCVNFSQTQYDVMEMNGMVYICVELQGEIDDPVTVQLFTIPGTAEG